MIFYQVQELLKSYLDSERWQPYHKSAQFNSHYKFPPKKPTSHVNGIRGRTLAIRKEKITNRSSHLVQASVAGQ